MRHATKTPPDRAPRWTDLLASDALTPGARRVVKTVCGKQVALFRLDDGGLRACNNRCPHEGYPLSKGSVSEGADGACLLTCNWHNWKFDLESGETLVGGDRLRTYPARERAGRIELDLADPPASEVARQAIAALLDSFDRHEYDRMARELARLEKAGGSADDALAATIRETADRLEYGATHALPAAADWLRLTRGPAPAGTNAPEHRLVAYLEAIGHFAWDGQRCPRHPFPPGMADWDEGAFLAAVEAEDEAGALARMRGALDAGLAWDVLEPVFARAALAHYADFGHSAIYTYKTRDLIAWLDPDRETLEAILAMLTRSLVLAPREDLIPEFKEYAPARAAWRAGTGDLPAADALARGSVRKVLAATRRAGAAADPLVLYDRLLAAAADQMLRFDLSWQARTDGPVSQNVTWLDFTHALTFGNAVRKLAERAPDIWPAGLLQIGCFLGRNAGFTDRTRECGTVPEAWAIDMPERFYSDVLDGLLDHGEFEYIVSAHKLKLTVALAEEAAERPEAPWHGLAAAALDRFLHSPLKRKHALRTARQSIDFVRAED